MYCASKVCVVGLQALLGDAATRRQLRQMVANVVTLRRRELLAVGQVLPGVVTSSLPWAPKPPASGNLRQHRRMTAVYT